MVVHYAPELALKSNSEITNIEKFNNTNNKNQSEEITFNVGDGYLGGKPLNGCVHVCATKT